MNFISFLWYMLTLKGILFAVCDYSASTVPALLVTLALLTERKPLRDMKIPFLLSGAISIQHQ